MRRTWTPMDLKAVSAQVAAAHELDKLPPVCAESQ